MIGAIAVTEKKPRGRPAEKKPNAFGQWIAASGKTQLEVSQALDVSAPYLNLLIHSQRRPGLDLAIKIRDLTENAIPPEFWQDIPKHSR